MSADTAFSLVNYGILPAWLLLVFAPRWRWTQRVVHSALIPAALGLVHGVMAMTVDFGDGAGGTSLKAAMLLFSTPWGAVVCWIHYLVFDLFVGAWVVRDAIRLKIPHLAVVPCLVMTNMFGPAGFLLYLALRFALRRTLTLSEA